MSERVFCDICGHQVGVGENKKWLNLGLYPMDKKDGKLPHYEMDLCERCSDTVKGVKVGEALQVAAGLVAQAEKETS